MQNNPRFTFALLLSALLGFHAAHSQVVTSKPEVHVLNGDTVQTELYFEGTAVSQGYLMCNGLPCEGVLETWVKDGSLGGYLGSRVPYSAGKAHGMMQRYYNDTTLAFTGEFSEGYAVGIHTSWHGNGQIFSVEYYPKDQPGNSMGQEGMTFFENGKIESQWSYHGEWMPNYIHEFTEEGEILYRMYPSDFDSELFVDMSFDRNGHKLYLYFTIEPTGERKDVTLENLDTVMTFNDGMKSIHLYEYTLNGKTFESETLLPRVRVAFEQVFVDTVFDAEDHSILAIDSIYDLNLSYVQKLPLTEERVRETVNRIEKSAKEQGFVVEDISLSTYSGYHPLNWEKLDYSRLENLKITFLLSDSKNVNSTMNYPVVFLKDYF